MDSLQYVRDILRALKAELVRFRGLAALLFALVFAAILVAAIQWPKYYRSEASVKMDNTNVIEPLLRGAAEVSNPDQTEKVADILYSRRFLIKVLTILDPESVQLEPEALEFALINLSSHMEVTTNKLVSTIAFLSSDPDDAYETLSTIVNTFISDRQAEKQKETLGAHDFIAGQVVVYKKRLEDAEQRLKEFKSKNVDIGEEAIKARISDLQQEIQNLEITIRESEEKIQTTRAQLAREGEYLQLRTRLEGLENRRTSLIEERDRLRLIYQDSYPDIVTITTQIDEIDFSIAQLRSEQGLGSSTQTSELPLIEELRKQMSTAEIDSKTQRRRLESLKEVLQQEYKLADSVASNQAELMDLTRDYNVTRDWYEKLLVRKENASLTLTLNDEGQGVSYKMVEAPLYPLRPAGISAAYVFLSAPFIAFLAPLGLAVAYVVLDPRIRSYTVLNSKLPEGISLLGYIPHKGSTLSSRLLRKDMLLLLALTIMIMIAYGYIFYIYGSQIL